MSNTKVRRKIFFFRLTEADDSGNRKVVSSKKILNLLDSLVYYQDPATALKNSNSRYVPLSDKVNAMGTWKVPSCKDSLILSKLRRDSLPQEVSGQSVKNLNLAKDSWLADSIHITFFKNGVYGAENNGYSVFGNKLVDYLLYRFPNVFNDLKVTVLTRKSHKELLSELTQIRRVEIEVHKNIISELKKKRDNGSRSLLSKIEPLTTVMKSDTVSISYAVGRTTERFISTSDFEIFSRLLADISMRPFIEKFRVKSRLGKKTNTEERNLLSNDLSFSEQVVKKDSRNRIIDSKDMVEVIKRVYIENRKDIENAGGIQA